MLDTADKLLERLLKPRLLEAVKAAGDLAPRQYGFRRGKSIIEAIQEVANAAQSTERGSHYHRHVCLLATFVVKKREAVALEFKESEYLLCII